MRNLANIHPISAIFGTVATAILMVAEYAVSSGRTGPPTLVDVFETFLSCDFLADVASELYDVIVGRHCYSARRLSEEVSRISRGNNWYHSDFMFGLGSLID
jgi:hypothetical protein